MISPCVQRRAWIDVDILFDIGSSPLPLFGDDSDLGDEEWGSEAVGSGLEWGAAWESSTEEGLTWR